MDYNFLKIDWYFHASFIILSIIGIILILFRTSLYGAGMTGDSATYISITRNLLSGKGYISFNNSLTPDFPPLFPLILAFIGLSGIDPYDGVRLFNAVVFGLIIYSS